MKVTFDLHADPTRIEAFVAQSAEYLESAAQQFPDDASATVDAILAHEPEPLFPVVIGDPAAVSEDERAELRRRYFGPHGVAHFAVPAAHATRGRHFILALAEQLAGEIPLAFPVDHPMEQHAEARKRFGEPDGTLKLYNLEIPEHIDKYREQAETKEMFAAHNDGLGYGGAVAASIIVLDAAPAWGGYTCFQQLVRASLALANDDPDAFRSLFLPDAIVALRPRGKGAIRVTSPVLYVNDRGEPQIFFRVSSGEYRITWRTDVPALVRARELLLRLAQPFAPSSAFVHLMHPGEGVIIRNTQVVHSRTPFEDDIYGTKRVLARKWFVPAPADQQYKHVPGMNVHPRYAELFPELFAPALLRGEWHYDPKLDDNVPATSADQ
jgi:Taurine catabolism dioxygenase TauD, TfdA family